jgi:phytoene dehydrogenase-like protein
VFIFNFNQDIDSIKKSKDGTYKLNSATDTFDKVIYNGDSARLYKLLNEPKMHSRTIKKERSTSGVVYYWQVKGTFAQLGLHNIVFSDDYRQEFNDIAKGLLPQNPTIYINITSKHEPKMAKQGYENWFVMINAPANLASANLKDLRQKVIQRLEKVLKTKIEVTEQEVLTPSIIQSRDNAYLGAIYGQSSNSPKSALFKQPNEIKGYQGLFLRWRDRSPGWWRAAFYKVC